MTRIHETRRGAGLGALAALAVAMVFPASAGAQTPAARQVTFTKDVAPILQRSCEDSNANNGPARATPAAQSSPARSSRPCSEK